MTPTSGPGHNLLNIVLFEPRIPPNTGNIIRLSACTGVALHLVEPLGFDLSDAQLRRAGLDYHDMALVRVHPDLDTTLAACGLDAAVYAFSARAATTFQQVTYRRGDVLLFGAEPTGLPPEVLAHPRVGAQLRIPMRADVRSLNLSVSVGVATYEGLRQLGYEGLC